MKKISVRWYFSILIMGLLFIPLQSCFDFEHVDPTPTPIPAPGDYESIAAGYSHSLALSGSIYVSYNTLWAWGDNSFGQLGDSTTVNKSIPISIGNGYTTISAGGSHSLALKYDTLFAWGDNRFGQLGDSTYLDKSSSVQIGTGYSQISAGFSHSLALKQDGTLWAWGDNMYGQLGDGTNENKNVPVRIGSGYASIAAGGRHSLALKTDGSLWAWGNNENGQVGDSTNEDRTTPVKIGYGYESIAAGGSHSLAKKADGTLWAWGNNEYGQLGDGTNENKNTPVKLATTFSGDCNLIAAGEYHSLAIKTDGTLWGWGKNDVGQAGGGTYADRNTPSLIGNSFYVAAGGFHSFALTAKEETGSFLGIPYSYYINHLWAWGDNHFGQLGCGTVPYFRNTPLHIGPG